VKKSKIRYFCLIVLISLVGLHISCINSEEYKKIKEEFRDVEYNDDFETFDSIYASIPDYSEVSSELSSIHAEFNPVVLLPYQSAGLYTSSKNTAVAIGMYIADLGYVRHFERVQYCMDYLDALRILIQKMAISSDDFNKMVPEFESNINNKDRLFEITDSLMSSGNILLSDNEMYGISALVLAGLWTETTYLGLLNYDEIDMVNANVKLMAHFEILKQINKLFDCLSDDSVISELKADLKDVEKKGPESQSLLDDIVLIRNKFSQ